ncbi:MAG: response regulator transcription factor [Acetobacterales bacterium]
MNQDPRHDAGDASPSAEVLGVCVLVVDDDEPFRDVVRAYLLDESYTVLEAYDRRSMTARIGERVPEIVLLDLKLPGDDGLTLAGDLRQSYPNIGIVMISGKEDVIDRVAALEIGADDYLVKPFHMREMLARIKSVLRRREPYHNGQPGSGLTGGGSVAERRLLHRFGDWTLDSSRRTLVSAEGRSVELTSGEFDLLLAFVSHPNRALTRDQLLDYAGSGAAELYDRSIDMQVARLRRKIERDSRRPALIKTIRNVGYMLSADVQTRSGS